MPKPPATIDEYLARVPAEQRAALQALRRTIRAAAPAAEECISYLMPAFRQGRMLVAFAAAKAHCSFFPMSSTTVAAHAKELARFETSKGTIRFTPERSLPATVVRKIVRARLAENAALDAGRPKRSAPARTKAAAKPERAAQIQGTVAERAAIALAELERAGNPKTLAEYGPRYGITTTKAFGVPMGRIHALAKRLGRDHALARALWKTGWYEARLLTAFVAEAECVTAAEMDRWTRGFGNWGVCDTLCFHLFDRTPHAFGRVAAWAKSAREFEKRAAFALLASLALHDKETDDTPFLRCLPLAERAAADERNFVKKSVSWALRGMGTRSRALHAACTALAERLSGSDGTPQRWIGRDVLRDLNRPLVRSRAEKRERARRA